MGQLFDELKRRNVFRVGMAYVIVGWIVIQITVVAVPALFLPGWVPTIVLYFGLIGFPFALLFAWAFELTPEGVKKTKNVRKDDSVTTSTGRKLDFIIIGALALGLGYFVWESRFAGVPGGGFFAEAEAVETSIAVLPFVNMSSDPEQEYFSDGISEEILNVLARIPNLHVSSRSSAFSFKGKDIDIPTVARQLGVAHVLEGSVRKSGVRVRITAQLIEASSDKHLWSGSYDRELDDIFAVQDEISAAIVAALAETLGFEVAKAPQVKAAANADAYNAYLLGQHMIRKRTKADIEASIPNFERAIELDPGYAPAHANLALAWRLLVDSSETYGSLTLEESLARAMPHIEKAMQLDPELADAHGVMGLIQEARGKIEEALAHYEHALGINPSLTNVRNWYSLALAGLGRETEAFQEIETAYRLDPLSRLTSNNYANNLVQRRRFDDLKPVLERMDQIEPAVSATFRGLALFAQQKAADGVITWLRGVDASPKDMRLKGLAAAGGLGFMRLSTEALLLWPFPDGGWPIISAGTDFDLTLKMAQQRYQDDPDNPDALAALAWAYFEIGDSERAEKLAERHISKLGPARRPIAFTNYIAVLGAWARGDEAAMQARLAPLEASVDASFDAGIDISELHWAKAQIEFLRGQTDRAYERAERALSLGMSFPRQDFPYRHLGWDEIPRFLALKERFEAYIAAERLKLLAVACGDDGFEAWRPLPKTCALLDAG